MTYNTKQLISFAATLLWCTYNHATVIALIDSTVPAPLTRHLTFSVAVPRGEHIYHDSVHISVDHPDIHLSWQPSIHPTACHDSSTEEPREIYNHSFNLLVDAIATTEFPDDAHIHITYQASPHKIAHQKFPLIVENKQEKGEAKEKTEEIMLHPLSYHDMPSYAAPSTEKHGTCERSWTDKITDLLSATDSLIVRLLCAFFLGILLSLTPCIYPMIPITIGIIQSQAQKSLLRNFLLAGSYTSGMALVYSFLGFLVAYTGQKFGALSHNPFVIILILVLLLYLAFSMIGFYEMYIPRFLQSSQKVSKRGPFLSAFLFGMLSGTVASPCLSPGLILLLTLAATMNKVTGFLLLLSFGLGLSILLLIIGTFSGTLTMLPKAGMWMVEVKRFFGFIMLVMCNYFLRPLVPIFVTHGINVILGLVIGIFYLYKAYTTRSRFLRCFMDCLGIICIALGIISLSYTVKETVQKSCAPMDNFGWNTDYLCAYAQAKEQGKLILVDISGKFCSICSLIEKKFFISQTMVACSNHFVFVKLDITDTTYTDLYTQYAVIGVPTILVIDPVINQEITRYGPEVYDLSLAEFLTRLQEISKSCQSCMQ